MLLEKQCCNIDYSEKLKEFGVNQKSLYYHTHSKWDILPKKSIDFSGNPTSAFTVAELIQMNLNITWIDFSAKKGKFYTGCALNKDIVYYETFADSIASVLLHSIKNKWVTVDEINARMIP